MPQINNHKKDFLSELVMICILITIVKFIWSKIVRGLTSNYNCIGSL